MAFEKPEPQTPTGVFIQETNEEPKSPYPTKKNKWEDNYKRATFYVQKDVMAIIEREADNEKGEKTRIINEALQDWIKKKRR